MQNAIRQLLLMSNRPAASAMDEFTTNRAAGAVPGTAAEPGPSIRNGIDSASHMSIASDLLTFDGDFVASGDPSLTLSVPFNRQLGRLLFYKFTTPSTLTNWKIQLGWAITATGTPQHGISGFSSTFNQLESAGSGTRTWGVIVASTTYQLCLVNRASLGLVTFIKGGIYTNWTLVWPGVGGVAAIIFPSINQNQTVTCPAFTFDYIRAISPAIALWMPTPLASDSFDGAFGTTDGFGHLEGLAGGLGTGGFGVTWTQQIGTWANASGKLGATALSGGIAIATVPTSTKDVIADIKVTRSAGQGGTVLRYADSSNYLYVNHDGTNCFLKQVLAGVTTTLITAAATYSANAVARVSLFGNLARLYYNNALVGSTSSINAGLIATAHGAYVTDTTVQLDDLAIFATGSSNEYAALDTYNVPA